MKVLVAENNAELLKLLSHLIEREGFKTLPASGGGQALQLYRAERPDIVCLDILMDDMSGYDVCREIRRADTDTPVIFITSKSGGDAERLGRAAGGDEYIVKPFDLAEVKRLMRGFARQLLARREAARIDEGFDFGDMRILPHRLLARRGNEDIDLSPLEVSVCQYFAGRAGGVISAAELHGALFQGLASAPDARAVEVHLKQLQKKIEVDPGQPLLIRPVDGGYSFG